MAIVNDFQRRKLVIKMNGREIRGLRADDINGRLAVARLALGIIGLKIAPVVRAVGAAVTPMRMVRRLSLGNGRFGGRKCSAEQ